MSEIGRAYDATGAAWRDGPARVYARLAVALLDHAPVPLTGARVLDVGAGTGVASREAQRRGAGSVIATDLAAGMLAVTDGIPIALADVRALPFRDDTFDLVTAAFVFNHLADPVPAMAEARRVATGLAASTFDPTWDHPAKHRVDEVMTASGFVPEPWYVELQERESADADQLRERARAAGFEEITVSLVEVDAGLDTPASIVDWRWGMAHLAPYVVTLAPERRAELRVRCEEAVTGLPSVVVPMLALSAR